jgi:putative membrane protein
VWSNETRSNIKLDRSDATRKSAERRDVMFIDYLATMLINLVAALVLVALYLIAGIDKPDQKRWVPGFAITGFVLLVSGWRLLSTWPLPGSYDIAFGGAALLFGAVLAGAALAQAFCWDMLTVTVYAFFAGLASIVLGVRVINLGMSQQPVLAGIGYILAGLGGVLATPVWYLRRYPWIRWLAALALLATALIWAIIGYGAYWEHLADFAKWTPPGIQQ